ncbi:MAG: hypothetical protein AAB892_01075 [Patescibacteria group bacterium]
MTDVPLTPEQLLRRAKSQVTAPASGRILVMLCPEMPEWDAFDELVSLGAPSTEASCRSRTWEGDRTCCQDRKTGRPLVLLNYGLGSHTYLDDPLAWGQKEGLVPACVHTCLGISAAHPNLPIDRFKLHSEPGFSLFVPIVYDHESERRNFRIAYNGIRRTLECSWAGYGISGHNWSVFEVA